MEEINQTRKSFATSEGEEHLRRFPTPKTKGSDENLAIEADLFAQAIHNLINEKTFQLFIKAVTEKETTGSNEALAFLQNRIIQECLNLSERDTELVLNSFERSARDWFLKNYTESTVDSRVYRRISRGMNATDEGKKDIHLKRGVQNVISFLKARAKLLESSPAQDYNFYFSSKLDAKFKIDVIEEIGSGENLEISLFQIKSSIPSEEEILAIHNDHNEWVKSDWLDMEKYEESYTGTGTSEELMTFNINKERIEEALLEFLTNPEGSNLQTLLDSLHFSDFNHRQQAWVLWKYIDLLKNQLDMAVDDGILDSETKDMVWKELSSLKEKLQAKAKLPKSQTAIKKVRSVISVGARIVSERELTVENSGKTLNIR